MSAQTVCDFCREAINGTPKITSTEKDGQKLDFCTTTCFIDFTRDAAAKTKCRTCDGEGRTDANADISERAPWSFWEKLPPGSDLAVRLGLVKPIDSTGCNGTGQQS